MNSDSRFIDFHSMFDRSQSRGQPMIDLLTLMYGRTGIHRYFEDLGLQEQQLQGQMETGKADIDEFERNGGRPVGPGRVGMLIGLVRSRRATAVPRPPPSPLGSVVSVERLDAGASTSHSDAVASAGLSPAQWRNQRNTRRDEEEEEELAFKRHRAYSQSEVAEQQDALDQVKQMDRTDGLVRETMDTGGAAGPSAPSQQYLNALGSEKRRRRHQLRNRFADDMAGHSSTDEEEKQSRGSNYEDDGFVVNDSEAD